MKQPHRGPIFLAGADRSGTTLMSAILSSHPNIALARLGSNMFTFFFGKYGDLRQRENFERCLAALLKYKHVQILNPDPARICAEFWAGQPSYARLFALIQDHFAEQQGRPRWGDKTSYIERYADPILAADPTAKFIHMVRDPRDRYTSSIAKYKRGRGKVGGATARWLYSIHLAQRNLKRYPDNYRIVRYETLVAQPEATIQAVCAFLGEAYDPAMLTLTGAEQFLKRGGNSSFDKHALSGISTAPLGRFRKVMSKGELAFMQAHVGRELLRLGYERAPVRFSLGERIAYGLRDWPANSVRMIVWRTLEAVQHNFPARFGRVPLHSENGAGEDGDN
ncbi:MAG TPA: sulfotransferase [Anaerolineae bacterium]|nr:sulfotransferase [Anaerolineae bacterium]